MNESEWGLLLGMMEMGSLPERWQIDEDEVRRQTYRGNFATQYSADGRRK